MTFKEQFQKSKSATAAKFSNAQKITIIALMVVGVFLVGFLVTTISSSNGKSADSTGAELVAGAQDEVERKKREILTGAAVATDDNSEIRIRLYVDSEHEFKEIWANYSDDIGKLDESPGTTSEPLQSAPEGDEVHEVFVDIDTIENDKKYYYQAVGRDGDDNLVYGQIASFSILE